MVALLPSALRRRTVSRASFSSGPAMYRSESFWTTGRGTAGSRRTIARSKIATGSRFYVRCDTACMRQTLRRRSTQGAPSAFAHEALARSRDERDRLGKEHAHRVTECADLLVGRTGGLELR